MSINYRIENLFADELLCINPSVIERIYSSVQVFLSSGHKIQSLFDPVTDDNLKMQIENGVAYVHVTGLLVKHSNIFTRFFGDTSYDELARKIRQLANDDGIRAIVLLFDTPGGTVSGVADCADVIYESREQKPIIALANDLAASGGVWLATAATEFNVTQTSISGSIGSLLTVTEFSKLYEEVGIGKHVIRSGEFKAIGGPDEPLSDKFRAAIQEQVDQVSDLFIQSVARHLATSEQNVRSSMAEGKVFFGKQAVEIGLANRVTTLEKIIAEYGDQDNESPSFISGVRNGQSNIKNHAGRTKSRIRSGFNARIKG